MFGSTNGGNAAGVDKAAAAVGAVTGEQILKAIVDAAGKDVKAGKKAAEAKNAIEAAIGAKDADAAAFGADKIGKKNDQIAAAIVLRGIAKGGKFDLQDGGDKKKQLKSVVEAALMLVLVMLIIRMLGSCLVVLMVIIMMLVLIRQLLLLVRLLVSRY
ncbi:variable large family protein [Borreliella americana]|uniref:variable large family protein n=1 Tax=Borreliella americana TaxID=478807 RepID=UPI001E628A3F|nr:variable large family protein [Borreliella americana]MCD2332824.1 variable large family protein [Borreliella americana]